MAEALCADDPEPDRWFPEGQNKDIAQLKLICGVCPVVEDCLLSALRSIEPPAGIWGGTTATERRTLRREVNRTFHVKHGLYRYKFKGCRCGICNEANRIDKAKYHGPLTEGDPRHGTMNAYTNHKCRCDICRVAWNERQRNYRARKALPA